MSRNCLHLVLCPLLSCLLAVLLVGCEPATAQPPGESPDNSVSRETSPSVKEADVDQLTRDNNTFACELYQTLRVQSGNLFWSPYSLSTALAMTYGGARGLTAQQMAAALHFTLPQENLHPAMNALDLKLAARSSPKDEEAAALKLHVVNRLWAQQGETFLPDYLNLTGRHYGAAVSLLDFQQATQAAEQINTWVEQQTEDRIKDLVQPSDVQDATLVLTNAIYFKGLWQHPFEEKRTKDGTFTLLDGATITTPMMHQTENFPIATGEGFRALQLPYGEGDFALLIVLPDSGKFADVEKSLDLKALQGVVSGLRGKKVRLALPKFEFTSKFQLEDQLRTLGMILPFSSRADFSGMNGQRNLFIGGVIHQAFVLVDETGTEAAAATAVPMLKAAAQPIEDFAIDRPFIFLIRDTKTGAILFMGRVVDPRGEH